MDLWTRGNYKHMQSSNSCVDCEDSDLLLAQVEELEREVYWSSMRLGSVSNVRHEFFKNEQSRCLELDCPFDVVSGTKNLFNMRGGANVVANTIDSKLKELILKYGNDFKEAILQNEKEHAEDCNISCDAFYCAPKDTQPVIESNVTVTSYNFGATPPEDFANVFGFPLDIIKVSDNSLFPAEEAASVVKMAEEEGVANNEYKSGKYRLGGDWLVNLPKTREWFNSRLESTFFPLISNLFPEIVSSPSVLRAHSVSLLKYNASHPRTDVHIDNGILAMTVAMTPKNEYVGGGTFFEHMGIDDVLPMDVGHGTFRPGSVRHGGHKVTKGTRYILGAFLLIEDRVEHVRRLKNRGSELRRIPDLEMAAKHFEWALGINPKCTTCLKDWAEILLTQKRYGEAEEKIRQVLELLEEKDSDALFSLGVILSEAGKDDESIEAYTKSVKLNAEDVELCYNLGIKLGAKGDIKGEMAMYARATTIDPTFGGAWLNWGTALAESGNMEDAEVMFLKGLECPEVKPKAMMNLGLVYSKKAELSAANGDLESAKSFATKAGSMVDSAKPLLDANLLVEGTNNDDDKKYAAQYVPLRLTCHRILGSVFAGMKDFDASEKEFRKATENFPQIPGAWEMLARVLEIQGKASEAIEARSKRQGLL
eukprot:CAMPEP_0194089318 /NCGR_PEP_ID=MMETSP0149-20130528/33730_1 /TAXON_ID=122233 /ORGANISM="Chaetoceros debilis, Strain MM31A-1" /LENGTH=650 /DNA_ID=CAMNT_0038773209 /DNA_START=246 /DNA_END=2198 /DNA_ORIENTATION=+